MTLAFSKFIFLFMVLLNFALCLKAVYYDYAKYTYRKKRDDKLYRARQTSCEMTKVCQHENLMEQTACIRQCISPPCYEELYKHDPLEEGEIDVRLNSFKGCLYQNPQT